MAKITSVGRPSLSMYTELTDEQIDQVTGAVKAFLAA